MNTIKTNKPCIMLEMVLECDRVRRLHGDICLIVTEGLYKAMCDVMTDVMVHTACKTFLGASLRVISGEEMYYWVAPVWGRVEIVE